MNEEGALRALRAGPGASLDTLTAFRAWLNKRESIKGRYASADLGVAVRAALSAAGDPADRLHDLLSRLENPPNSVLVGLFPRVRADGSPIKLPGAFVGPAEKVREKFEDAIEIGMWPDDDVLAVAVDHPAQGRLGALRAGTWLQTALGAITLGCFAESGSIHLLASCPSLEMAWFATGGSAEATVLDEAAAIHSDAAGAVDLDALENHPEAHAVIRDATCLDPENLAQARLTLAARSIQVGTSSVGTADAFVFLGIALETLVGDKSKAAVVDRVTKRSAVFLASAADEDERADVFYDELRRARQCYELRSRASHGQYNEWKGDLQESDGDRARFQAFVMEVALAFRRHALARNMTSEEDLKNWWNRAELQGLFA